MTTPTAPRVFLSYAQESAAHNARVLRLAQRLRTDGVDTLLDRFVVAPQRGWSWWMQEQIERADRVIAVCTPAYQQRAAGLAPPDVGRGVAWEWHLLRGELYRGHRRPDRLVLVYFEADDAHRYPPEAWDRPRYAASTSEGYESLLADLTGRRPHAPAMADGSLPLAPLQSDGIERPPPDLVQASAVSRLLGDLYTRHDLGRLVLRLPQGAQLYPALPPHAAVEGMAIVLVQRLLEQGGLGDLKEAVRQDRPLRAREIDAAWKAGEPAKDPE
jgi:hypothetical protein